MILSVLDQDTKDSKDTDWTKVLYSLIVSLLDRSFVLNSDKVSLYIFSNQQAYTSLDSDYVPALHLNPTYLYSEQP